MMYQPQIPKPSSPKPWISFFIMELFEHSTIHVHFWSPTRNGPHFPPSLVVNGFMKPGRFFGSLNWMKLKVELSQNEVFVVVVVVVAVVVVVVVAARTCSTILCTRLVSRAFCLPTATAMNVFAPPSSFAEGCPAIPAAMTRLCLKQCWNTTEILLHTSRSP